MILACMLLFACIFLMSITLVRALNTKSSLTPTKQNFSFGKNPLILIETLNKQIVPKKYSLFIESKLKDSDLDENINCSRFILLQQGLSTVIFITLLSVDSFKAGIQMNIFFSLSIGFLIPLAILFSKSRSRLEKITESIPYFADLLTLSCEAGLDILASLVKIIESMPRNPLKEIIESILKDIKMGTGRKEALKKACEKSSSFELKTVFITILQAETLGTSVGKSLRTQVEMMRKERMNTAERQAQKAPLKLMIPLLFFIFPVTFALLSAPIILRFLSNELF